MTEIFEPTTQDEYLATLQALDNDVQTARRAQRDIGLTIRDKQRAMEKAAIDWEAGEAHRTPQDCLRDVMDTQRKVASGEIPTKRENYVPMCEVDRVAHYSQGGNKRAGGGFAFRRNASTTQEPRPIQTTVAPMKSDGPVTREGVVTK